MTAIMNGLCLHGGVIPFGGTFLVFSDYARNAIRMSAIMKQRVISVLTHDSIGLGEDGPTHQPIEHLASLRLIPHLHVWRPCDAVETMVAWKAVLFRQYGPAVLALSRQTCAPQDRAVDDLLEIECGGYVLKKCDAPELIFAATGSEVQIAMDAARQLEKEGHRIRVVSMPCVDVFYEQDHAYQMQVIPQEIPLIVIEAGVTDAWYRLVQNRGMIMGIDQFGASAPAPVLFEYFGLTVERAVACARTWMKIS
jgi:transketolase